MSTRATYEFAMKGLPTLTFYIHHDGYPEGAAHYFWQMHHCERRGTHAERFLVANDRAELTAGRSAHGDTEYHYTLTGDSLVAYERKYDRPGEEWEVFFVGDWWEFVNKYGRGFCEGFELLKPLQDKTVYGNGARVVRTRKQLQAAIDEKQKYLAEYKAAHPTMVGNISSIAWDLSRAEANLEAYEGE